MWFLIQASLDALAATGFNKNFSGRQQHQDVKFDVILTVHRR